MKERPILFSAPMVRALLAGTKTQTRRVVKPQPMMVTNHRLAIWDGPSAALQQQRERMGRGCPYGQPGDRLWVRETWARDDEDGALFYRADVGLGGDADDWERNRLDGVPRYRWRPSIHMHRRASRITLEITGVRAERLQDISEADAIAEGVKNSLHLPGGRFAKENFAHLWWTINGDGSWEANPWVWVIEFKRVNT